MNNCRNKINSSKKIVLYMVFSVLLPVLFSGCSKIVTIQLDPLYLPSNTGPNWQAPGPSASADYPVMEREEAMFCLSQVVSRLGVIRWSRSLPDGLEISYTVPHVVSNAQKKKDQTVWIPLPFDLRFQLDANQGRLYIRGREDLIATAASSDSSELNRDQIKQFMQCQINRFLYLYGYLCAYTMEQKP